MTTHAWAEHVVHVRLVSGDHEIAATTARLLELRFAGRDIEVHHEPGHLRLHSEAAGVVTAADTARALADGGVRASAVHERVEWSVADVQHTSAATAVAP